MLPKFLHGLFLIVLLGATAHAESPTRPNIVLFLVDDMGWQDTSVPFWEERTPANNHFRTPNMERLAAQGIRFTNARAHPVCSPTRTSIMTGQIPVRHHVTNWTLYPDKDPSKEWGRVGSPTDWRLGGIQPEDLTLPKLLREQGYRTIHAGKAHWGGVGTPGSDPLNLGFDVNIGGHSAGAPGSYQGLENFGNKKKGGYSPPWGVPGLEQYHGQDINLTEATTLEAKRAVAEAVKDDKPFYLHLAHYAVHTPIQPDHGFLKNYAGRNYKDTEIDIPENEERYASMVEGMDASLGQIMDQLEELGMAENTLILFTSDNGGLSVHARGTTPRNTGADTHNWPAKAGKGSAYEGGTRVPFIAAWAKPNAENAFQKELPIAPNAISPQPVISEDLFPTILGLANATVPESHPVDGLDARPWLTQKESNLERPLYFHYPHAWGPETPNYQPHSVALYGDWKIIYFYNPRTWELYNLKTDLGEEHNLAQEQPERLKELASRMLNDLNTMNAQWPVDRKTGETEIIRLP